MVYRQAHQDERWQHVHEKLPEAELPERYHLAFRAFEQQLRARQPARPPLLELKDGSEVETYYPAYDMMKTESVAYAVLIAGFLWLMGLVPIALLGVGVLLLLPESPWLQPIMLGFYGVGSVVLIILLVPTVRDPVRHNKRKRAAGGLVGFGTYLLRDAIVLRYANGVFYYPRDRVQDVEIERIAAHTSGGGSHGPSRRHAAESYVHFNYLDGVSERKRTKLIAEAQPGHEPEPAKRLRGWIDRDGEAKADASYGKHTAEDLQRADWAAAWRSFMRRRRWAYVMLIGPFLLFLVAAVVDDCASANLIDDGLGDLWWLPIVVFLLPGFLLWLSVRTFRCPRCGKSPRQPLSGTDVTRCLSCGLPIFTKVAGK